MDPLTRPLVGVDYDERTSTVYDQSQELPSETFALWLDRFCHHAGPRRPQAVVDLGCGTGRFAPALAEAFGGLVIGVEPSRSMRAVAERLRAHPRVRYREGRAEELPLPDHSCDLLLMFLVLHHVGDRQAAARETARVLRPGGRLLVRSRFRGEPTPRGWTPYFPSADAAEQASLPTVAETIDLYEGAGLVYSAFDRVRTLHLREFAELHRTGPPARGVCAPLPARRRVRGRSCPHGSRRRAGGHRPPHHARLGPAGLHAGRFCRVKRK